MTESDFIQKLTFIQKLRRFSLVVGLILIAYSITRVQLETPAHISPLGFPFIIKRPGFLDIVLLLASIYGALRYFYYAILINPSPAKRRENLTKGLFADGIIDKNLDVKTISLKLESGFKTEFPSIGKYQAQLTQYSSDGNIMFEIPKQVKILCILEDIDYYSPIWVNFLALLLYISFRTYTLFSNL